MQALSEHSGKPQGEAHIQATCPLTTLSPRDCVCPGASSYLGEEFSAKGFRTWGGTLTAAITFAERGPVKAKTDQKRAVAAVMRKVGERLANTPAVARSSYVSPAVVEQYLDGRTIQDFRPRDLRVVRARDTALDPEEEALLSLLRSWRIRNARGAA